METHPWIVPLSDADGASSAFGGKAANLARLAQAGFRVAPGFCISIGAYEQFLEANRLRAVIQMELGRKPLDQMRWEEIWDAALRIRNRFLNSAIAEDLTQNRQDFSHRGADEKSLLDEVVRRGRGERRGRAGMLNGLRLVGGNSGTVKRGFSL